MNSLPLNCRICQGTDWEELYRGPVRQGRFGNSIATDRLVRRCQRCDTGWLEGAPVDYESDAYRECVDEGAGVAVFHRVHDGEQAAKLALLGTDQLRGRCIADIGCGAGSFLDLVRGMARATVAVEPARAYHAALQAHGHAVFPYAAEVAREWQGTVDVAVCFSVIEHLEDPVQVLTEIRALLATGGRLLISTPSRHDWLLELLPVDYRAFFYRAVHRWYFSAESLRQLGAAAGFTRVEPFFQHRFDLANFLLWLRDRRPSGQGKVEVEPVLDASFRASLCASGRSDYLYAWMSVDR